MYKKWSFFISLLILPLVLNNCARNPVTGKKEVVFMSEAQEQALGDQSDPQIVAAYGLFEDASMQAFIDQKGQQMAKVSHRPNLTYTFRVLDSPVVNAFALPGGYVYFTRGIMAHFNNEAQFAGVLGHEIGHITAKHSVKQQRNQILGTIGLMAGLVVSPTFRQFAEQASQGMSLMFLKFGRNHETESDQLGVEYSTKIGYDAHHMADFFETLNRLQTRAGASIPDFLSTHPNPVDRHANVHTLAEEWQVKYPQSKKVNRQSYLNLINGMIYGEDPKQGFVEGDKFYHPELKFEFPVPENWQLQNSPSMVQMAPQDGKALMQFMLSQEPNLQAAANKLVTEASLNVISKDNINVNGFDALSMVSEQTPTDQNGQQGETIKIMSYFIKDGNFIYVFHGMALQADYALKSRTFKSTFSNFKRLTNQAMINKKPNILKVVKVQSGGQLANVLSSFGVESDMIDETAIVNGMEKTQNVSKGDMIKIITK